MQALEELMRRCRHDGHVVTYQDLVALANEAAAPTEERVELLRKALELSGFKLIDATRLIDEEVLREVFERKVTCSYGFKRSRRGGYVNPVTANRWKWFKAGAVYARAGR